jgi:hypothetical protein
VGNSLGPSYNTDQAEALLRKWAESLPEVLLFLSNVRRIAVWRWDSGAAAPALVARVCKEYQTGGPCARLPDNLPAAARESHKALLFHLFSLSDQDRQALFKDVLALVRMSLDGAGSEEETRRWSVLQRFDVSRPTMLKAMAGCRVVPLVGIAMRFGDPAIAAATRGGLFCSLPVGSIETGLPVHLNAAFALLKNRRSLVYETTNALPEGDDHARKTRWNQELIQCALPLLWLELLRMLASRNTSDQRVQLVLRGLPKFGPASAALAGLR